MRCTNKLRVLGENKGNENMSEIIYFDGEKNSS